jgi:hypothetical protein
MDIGFRKKPLGEFSINDTISASLLKSGREMMSDSERLATEMTKLAHQVSIHRIQRIRSEISEGKASHSSSAGRREGRENDRCFPLPRSQKPQKAIYPPGKAWSRKRAWHRSREGAQDG